MCAIRLKCGHRVLVDISLQHSHFAGSLRSKSRPFFNSHLQKCRPVKVQRNQGIEREKMCARHGVLCVWLPLSVYIFRCFFSVLFFHGGDGGTTTVALSWNPWWNPTGPLESQWRRVSLPGEIWQQHRRSDEAQAESPGGLPSGELTFCHGKSPFFCGKIHYFYGHFPLLC